MTIPTTTIKSILKGERAFSQKQLDNCNQPSVDALVNHVLSWNLLKWNAVREKSIVAQGGDGITVSKDGEEATLIVSRASKYQDLWTKNTIIFESQSPTDDDTRDLTVYRNNKKLIRAIVEGTLDVKKLKIFQQKCADGWLPFDFAGKFIDIVPHLTNRGDLQFIVNMTDPIPDKQRAIVDVKHQLYMMVLFMCLYRLF